MDFNPVTSEGWGVVLIGCFISLILFGTILSQAFTYSQNCKNDPQWQKVFVGMVVFLDALSSAIAMAWMYQLFIDGWGDASYFTHANWLLASDPMICGILACMVQLFFAWRLHIIAKRPWLTAFIVLAATATFIGGVGTGIAVLVIKEYAQLGRARPIGCTWDFSAVIADMTITAGMTYYLRRYMGRFQDTDNLLDRIIQLTLQNGLLTSLATLVDIVLYLVSPKLYHIALTFVMPKLYSNSVLSSLNARKTLRSTPDHTGELGVGSESRVFHSMQSNHRESKRPEIFVEIHKTTELESFQMNKC